jgi:succinate dehydrogenase / fumarate reductase cytochrome b subunit
VHRVTGIGLTVYICVHIIALLSLTKWKTDGGKAFNEEMAFFQTPFFLFLEWAIGAFVLFHAFNGVRIVLVDLGEGARYHKTLLVVVTIAAVLIFLGMGFLIFQPHLRSMAQN